MPRIPEDELTRIKQEVSLLERVRAEGIDVKRHGADWIGRCPFHDDTTPSLVITPTKNLWHCLGACQAGGSVVDWVMRREGLSFRHAVDRLRAEAPGLVTPTVRFDPAMDGAQLLAGVVTYDNETLLQTRCPGSGSPRPGSGA